MHNLLSTVAAISTPPGKGGVALIRISGPEAIPIADRVFSPKSGKRLADTEGNTAVYGMILDGGDVIDDGIATVFRAPHSYTGEDTVEISCHGGLLLTNTVLSAVLTAGALLADPGEFTERAFVSGRLTLTDAEGVMGAISAESRTEILLASKAARTRLDGALEALRRTLTEVMASQFAAIDFPDEDLASLTPKETAERLTAVRAEMERLLLTYRTGRAITEGVRTVIVGRPNVGKSSLYNRLAGEELAIVTDIPGTTRDLLSETVVLDRVKLRLSDTAGLRETADVVERIGVERTVSAMENAELVLAVFDSSQPLTDEDFDLVARLKGGHAVTVAVLNKADLPPCDMEKIRTAFPHVVSLSAKSGDISALSEKIDALFTSEELTPGQDAIIAGERQFSTLRRAKEFLAAAIDSITAGFPEDIVAGDIERAIGTLGEIDGRTVNEEIVSDIFRNFCVGK